MAEPIPQLGIDVSGTGAYDLQQWLQRSGSGGVHRTSFGRHGLAGNLFEITFRLLRSLLEFDGPSAEKQKYQNEIERLFLWGDGFGAGAGSLDEILDKSTELKISVLSLLSELGKVAV